MVGKKIQRHEHKVDKRERKSFNKIKKAKPPNEKKYFELLSDSWLKIILDMPKVKQIQFRLAIRLFSINFDSFLVLGAAAS